MTGSVRAACSDCELCGTAPPGRAVPAADDEFVVRGSRWRHRRRSCDHCGHLIRHHALDVAPSPVEVVAARLPDDLPADDSAGLGWSVRSDR